MSYVLGLDLGTSSLKGIIVDEEGQIVFESSVSYPVFHSDGGVSEQVPNVWLEACDRLFDDIRNYHQDLLEGLKGISFSGQMHSLVLLDNKKNVLRNAILWNDTRTTLQCEEINRNPMVFEITKNKALEGFTLPKLLWVKENEPDIWGKVAYVLLPKDYLRYYLTGKLNMDYSDASGTLMLDMKQEKWSEEILEYFGIPKNILPKLVNSIDSVGFLRKELKDKYGIRHQVNIFAGGADNACAAIGAGLCNEGNGLCSIGTSGVLLTLKNHLNDIKLSSLHTFIHAIPNKYYSMGVTLSAGDSLKWFKENFYPETSFNELMKIVDGITVGSEGILFAPYLSGERCPHTDATIRGAFIGVTHQHTVEHFLSAVVEGITFSLKDVLELLENTKGLNLNSIVSVGGGAKSVTWLQMQSDVFNKHVLSLKEEQGPALGAAIIAMVGLKWYDNFDDAFKKMISIKKEYVPNKRTIEEYDEAYHRFKKIYTAIKNI